MQTDAPAKEKTAASLTNEDVQNSLRFLVSELWGGDTADDLLIDIKSCERHERIRHRFDMPIPPTYADFFSHGLNELVSLAPQEKFSPTRYAHRAKALVSLISLYLNCEEIQRDDIRANIKIDLDEKKLISLMLLTDYYAHDERTGDCLRSCISKLCDLCADAGHPPSFAQSQTSLNDGTTRYTVGDTTWFAPARPARKATEASATGSTPAL